MEGGRWLKIDWTKKVINTTDIHLTYWEEDRTELGTAEIKVELSWYYFTNLIPSLSDHSHGEHQIHVQTWSMTNPGGTSIQLWLFSWNTAEPTGLSLKALLTLRLAGQRYSESGNDSPTCPSSINTQFHYCFSRKMHVKIYIFPIVNTNLYRKM